LHSPHRAGTDETLARSSGDPFKRRYQVFVSSTYEDLVTERQAVMHALLELDCIPSGMELFPAADDNQWTLIKRVIDDCDYYIVIIAGRYGSLAVSGLSYTQMEYEYAISQSKPVIAFLHRDTSAIVGKKLEPTDAGRSKLSEFRSLAQHKVCKYWTTPDELGSVVSRSLVQLIKNKPGIGWVRGNLVTDESSAQEILNLRRRIDELDQLIPKDAPPRPGTRPPEYYSRLAEHFPRNAIQEAWSYLEGVLQYAIATHDLGSSDDFSGRVVALMSHGDLDNADSETLQKLQRIAYRAMADPMFKMTAGESLETIKEMIRVSGELIYRCDGIWNIRKGFPGSRITS